MFNQYTRRNDDSWMNLGILRVFFSQTNQSFCFSGSKIISWGCGTQKSWTSANSHWARCARVTEWYATTLRLTELHVSERVVCHRIVWVIMLFVTFITIVVGLYPNLCRLLHIVVPMTSPCTKHTCVSCLVSQLTKIWDMLCYPSP